MHSEKSNINLLLQYKLINLKKKALQVEELKEDIMILENALQSHNDDKILEFSHGYCSLELKGDKLKKRRGKYDTLQNINDLIQRNTYLKEKLKDECNATQDRDASVEEYNDNCEQIMNLFQNINEEDHSNISLLKNHLRILQRRIYNTIACTADIKKQFLEKEEELNTLKKKIQQYSTISNCIQSKKEAQENLIEESYLYETKTSMEKENKILIETISDLNKIYDNLSSQIEGLKEYNTNFLNQIVNKLCPVPMGLPKGPKEKQRSLEVNTDFFYFVINQQKVELNPFQDYREG